MPITKISLDDELHSFRKVNIVTELDEQGQYDTMKCKKCGIEGKCRDLRNVNIEGRYSVKITRCILSKKEYTIWINKQNFQFKEISFTGGKCTKCGEPVKKLNDWTDEESKEMWMDVVCENGHKEFLKQ